MKKLLVLGFILVAGLSYAGQPRSQGSIKVSDITITPSEGKTIAQFNSLTADTTGQLIACTNCVMSAVCVSSGNIAPGQWTVMNATATAALGGTLLHCQ